MQNIVVVPFPYQGPINGSLKLAKSLQSNGYAVTYVVPEQYRAYLEEQAFPVVIYPNTKISRSKTIWQKIKSVYVNTRLRDELLERYGKKIWDELHPIMALVDSDIPRYAAVLQKYTQVTMYSITPSNDREKNIPPYFSRYIPNGTYYSMLYIDLLWNLWYLKKKIYFLKYEVLSLGRFDFNLKNYYKKYGLDKGELNHERAWPVGFRNLKELLFYPPEFEYDRTDLRAKKTFIGPMIDFTRSDNGTFDWNSIERSRYLICCSMGTLAGYHFRNVMNFYKLLIAVMEEQSDITLILACGDSDLASIGGRAKNIYVFQQIPLLTVLKKTDLLISHGGFNSVKESIMQGVPLLLFPLNKLTDQNGVAARCVFHGIAKRCDIRKTSAGSLRGDIREMLTSDSFKKNTIRLREIFINSEMTPEALLRTILPA